MPYEFHFDSSQQAAWFRVHGHIGIRELFDSVDDFLAEPQYQPGMRVIADLCDVTTPDVTLAANVCNRGTNPVADGARVVFYDGDPDIGAPIACETTLPRLLEVGDCTEVSCSWRIPGGGTDEARDIVVVVDPDGEVFECRDGNNRGVIPDVYCGLI